MNFKMRRRRPSLWKRQRRTSPSGFTLLELVVVILILGMLIGFLLPVINHVRDNARRTRCASRLKQIGLLYATYIDKNGKFPKAYPNDHDDNYSVFHTLAVELGLGDDIEEVHTEMFALGDAANSVRPSFYGTIFACPAVRQSDTDFFRPWVHYAQNGWLDTYRVKDAQQKSSTVMLAIDAKGEPYVNTGSIGSIALRHQGFANVLFLDYHVDTMGEGSVMTFAPENIGFDFWMPE